MDILYAQEEGKLGDFEDAVKGEKSDSNEDYGDDDGSWLGFFFNIGIDAVFSDDDSDEDYYNGEDQLGILEDDKISFGTFPFDSLGMVNYGSDEKPFLGRISGSYQRINDFTEGLRINARIQFSGRHGINLDYTDYIETLERGTDHLQFFGVSYRNLVIAEDELLLAVNIGLSVLKPDNNKDASYGLNLAMDSQWFFVQQVSINGKIGFAPILDKLYLEEPPGLWNLEIGAGFHLQNVEFFASYRTMIPTYNTSASLYGPEAGIRFWF